MLSLILFLPLFAISILYGQKSDLNAAKVIIVISWVGGSLVAYGLIPSNANDLILIIIPLISIIPKIMNGRSLRMPFVSFFLLIFIFSIVSMYVNDSGVTRLLLFNRYFFQSYLILLFFVNSDIDDSDLVQINRLFIQIFVLQVMVATIKWGILEREGGAFGDESFGGTYATNDGSASLLITLIAFSFLIPAYFISASRKYLLFMLLFIWFVLVGAKRGVIVMLPLLSIFIYLLMNRKTVNFKSIFAMIVILFGSLTLITSTNETLNPEGQRGGSALDIGYIVNYVIQYEMGGGFYGVGQKWGDVDAEGLYSTGRLSTPIILFQNLSDQGKVFTGIGSGKALNSGLVDGSVRSTFFSLGIEGGISGFTWIVAQIGYLGGLSFLFFLLRIFWMTTRKYLFEFSTKSEAVYLIGLLGLLFTFIFDYMIYSQSMIRGEWYYTLLFYLVFKIHFYPKKLES